MKINYLLNILLAFTLTACTDDTQNGESPNPGDSVTLDALYDQNPDITSCFEGVLKDSAKQQALETINNIRAIHGLPAVAYNAQGDGGTAKSALISVANQELSHTPPANWHCHTDEGAAASGTSNLHLRFTNDFSNLADNSEPIVSFIVDNNVDSLGHRRWLLDPFLSKISYGRVDGIPLVSSNYVVTGATVKVSNVEDSSRDISTLNIDFVAYPYQNYPAAYFKHGWYMSFSLLTNKTSRHANGSLTLNSADSIDYANAQITVTDSNGSALSVVNKQSDHATFGLPNILKWQVTGTKNNETYQVEISNVKINDVTQAPYSYSFTIN